MSVSDWNCEQKTDVGTVRKVNEDSCLSVCEAGLWCVADGMGGHARGDVASQLITKQLFALVNDTKTEHGSAKISAPKIDEIYHCIEAVNQSLIELSKKHDSIVGSTVAILLITQDKIHCIWAGDSRIYRVRNHQIVRLTRDHSQVEDMVEAGIISAKEAETHPKANIITRAVGAHDILELELATYDVDENDQFLLCSDGLNKVMSDTEILNFVSHCPFEGVADVFIEQAISRQARDNVTVILVQHKNHKADFLRETLPLDATLPLNTR